MLRVDSKQGAPKDGHYPLELFHVNISGFYVMTLFYVF